MSTTLNVRKRLVAAAAAPVASAVALPAAAAIVSTGATSPNPASGTVVGRLEIGPSSAGTVTVNAGSTLNADLIGLGTNRVGNGKLTVTGAGSKTSVTATLANTGNLDMAVRESAPSRCSAALRLPTAPRRQTASSTAACTSAMRRAQSGKSPSAAPAHRFQPQAE